MTALPDIKTANKVVELILKNASIAVTGIWLADDDGVLNPANVKLVPGSIIPKAVGSAGLTPLQAPGRFDVSQLVLDDLRARIRHTLLTDRLGTVADRRMTATEVLERSGEMTRLLGAMFGRLQAELLSPLVHRAVGILRRRGELPGFVVDGTAVELQSRAPLARLQARQDVQNVLLWLDTITRLGPEASGVLNMGEAARWLATMLGVPDELVAEPSPLASLAAALNAPGMAVSAPEPLAGWAWLEAPADPGEPSPDLCRAAAACLGTPDGRLLVRHLRRTFLDRRLPPASSDAELRHLEGQRSVVAHLLQLWSAAEGPHSTRKLPFPTRGTPDERRSHRRTRGDRRTRGSGLDDPPGGCAREVLG